MQETAGSRGNYCRCIFPFATGIAVFISIKMIPHKSASSLLAEERLQQLIQQETNFANQLTGMGETGFLPDTET